MADDPYSDGTPGVMIIVECDDSEVADRLARLLAAHAGQLCDSGNVSFTATDNTKDTMPGIGRRIEVYAKQQHENLEVNYEESQRFVGELLDLLEDAKGYITPTLSTHEEISRVLYVERDIKCDCGYCEYPKEEVNDAEAKNSS